MLPSNYSITVFIAFLILLQSYHGQGQTNKVSPKLDLDDTEDKNNSSVPIVPGVVQGRTDGHNVAGGGRESSGSGDASTGGGGGSGKTGPKIHGVRVTVDTGDTQKSSKESKESVEITDLGKHKKRVGIHTDITFEISAGDDDGNATSSAQKDDKEDASVPIYKGRGGSSTHKPRKSYDPKYYWNPNFSSERRGYDTSGRGNGPGYGGGYYPQYPTYNVPVYTGSDDSRASSGGTYNTRGDGWTNYVPSLWTTERPYYEPYKPNTVTGYRTQNWKPCYCITSGSDNRRRRQSNQDSSTLRPTSSIIQVVDGKLEQPFSRK